MAFEIVGTPISFFVSGAGSDVNPYFCFSTNIVEPSASEIIFKATEGGRIFLNFSVDSELLYDVAEIKVGALTLWLASGQVSIVESFAVVADDEVKITYTKNATISIGNDEVNGTIYFAKDPLPASKLIITTQPATATTGLVLLTQPVVEVYNDDNLLVTTAVNVITVVRLDVTGACTLTGDVSSPAVAGVLTYDDLVGTGTGSFRLIFSSVGLVDAVSDIVYFTLPAVTLHITTQTSALTTTTLVIPQQPVVEVRDSTGAVVARPVYEITVIRNTLTETNDLSGTLVIDTVDGVASYSDLIGTGTGTFNLEFSSPTFTNVVSITVAFTTQASDAGSYLIITTQPGPTVIDGDLLDPQPILEIRDVNDDIILELPIEVTAVVVVVTGAPEVATGDLIIDSSQGVITYSGLLVTGNGTCRLRFSSPGLDDVTSNLITIAAYVPPTAYIPVRPKRSYTPGDVPLADQLMTHELAINVVDQKGWVKDEDDVVKLVFEPGAGGGGADFDNVVTALDGHVVVDSSTGNVVFI